MPHRKYAISHLIWVSLWLLTCSSVAPSQSDTASSIATDKGKEGITGGQAVTLGVVEGLTEYLPISSTGHLLIAQRIMGIGESTSRSSEIKKRTKDASDAYTICIQFGAIIAVLGLYFRRVREMTRGLVEKDLAGRRLLLNVAAGFLPAASIGLLFNETIKTHLFGPWPVVTAWLSNNPKDEIDLADLEAKGFRPSEDVQLTVADGNQETLSLTATHPKVVTVYEVDHAGRIFRL